jgi:hypothetical protein
MMGQAASRGQDLEIADALKLLEQLGLTGKLEGVTSCQNP